MGDSKTFNYPKTNKSKTNSQSGISSRYAKGHEHQPNPTEEKYHKPDPSH